MEHTPNIIVYTKTGCPWRDEVLDFLEETGVSFEERNMSENNEFRKEAIEKSGVAICPTLDIDGHILADSDAAEVRSYLKSIGVLK
ncbi:MAG TPA: glutaredoxin family protein [Candidatus Paceibacterota bacterium]|nr:glutaredoxin family protein [Candidatus Paceibacterota bacterium]